MVLGGRETDLKKGGGGGGGGRNNNNFSGRNNAWALEEGRWEIVPDARNTDDDDDDNGVLQ